MADSDKNIIITPNRGLSGQPEIYFGGSGGVPIRMKVLDDSYGTLSWEGSAGQLFSINNNLTSGSIFSVNDVSGIPSIEVNANGTVTLAPYGGNVGIGVTAPNTLLHVGGTASASGFSGPLLGNATTATTLATSRNFSLTGDVTASAVSFNGGGNVELTTAIAAGSIVNADINASAGIVDTKLATISTAGKVSNSATTATNANTANAIVARDGSGNFSAGTITASLTGTASNASSLGGTAAASWALLASPTFTGTPSAPTATSGTNTTQIATTQFVRTEVSNLVASAPTTLDTLNELATALGNDPNFATTVTTALGNKAGTTGGGASGTWGISVTGNAGTATTLANSRNFSLTGDVTASAVSFNGGGNVELTTAISAGSIVNADINASAAIATSKLAANTISGVALGSNLNTLTIGTGLGGSSYNGSSAVTITNNGVTSFNGLTGAVGGVCAAQANTFTALQTFTIGISAAGGITMGGTVAVNGRIIQNAPGTQNLVIGDSVTGNALSTKSNCIAIGHNAMRGSNPGSNNFAIGHQAMQWAGDATSPGTFNLAFGNGALIWNTTGERNSAIGTQALIDNRTGSNNVGLGFYALQSNYTGNANIGIGSQSLSGNISGYSNVGIGDLSLSGNSGGWRNIAIGTHSGWKQADGSTNVTTSYNSIFIGSATRSSGNAQDNQIVIGVAAIGDGSNTTVIGTSSTTSTRVFGTLSTNGGISAAGATFSGNVIATDGYRVGSASIVGKTGGYTLAASDDGKVLTFNSPSALVVNIGTAAGYTGFFCSVVQLGTGGVRFASSGGTILNSYNGLTMAGQHASATVMCYQTNVFNVSGNLVI